MKEFIELYDKLMINLSKEEEVELQKTPLVKYDERVWAPVQDWLNLKGLPVKGRVYIDDSEYIDDEDGCIRVPREKPIITLFLEKWQPCYHDIMMDLFGNYAIEANEIFDEDGPTGKSELEITTVISNN